MVKAPTLAYKAGAKQMSSDMRKAAIGLFNEGKQDGLPLDDVLLLVGSQQCGFVEYEIALPVQILIRRE